MFASLECIFWTKYSKIRVNLYIPDKDIGGWNVAAVLVIKAGIKQSLMLITGTLCGLLKY